MSIQTEENTGPKHQNKEWFDVILVVPLEEELLTLMEVFPGTINRSTPKTFRHEVKVDNNSLRVLVVQQEGMGRSHAARATSESLAEFDAGVVVCIGIAGSLTSDLKLGDVCYCNNIADVLDNARAVDTPAGQLDLSLSLTYFSTPREVVAAFNFCRVLPELQPKYKEWQSEQEKSAEALGVEAAFPKGSMIPASSDGLIVCAAVSKSEVYNQKLRNIDRKVLAVETESGGIFDETARRSIPTVTIRGISDRADGNKSQLEQQTGGKIRKLAAKNAATFFKLQLSNPYFLRFLEGRRLTTTKLSPIGVEPPKNNDRDLVKVIGEVGTYIDDQLRELSPDFRLQQRGYRLPTPRMRQVQLGATTSRPDPIEIREALQTRSHVLLHLARSYPDYSLAWVLASDLLTAEINGKQPIPIVINGENISPPRSGFRTLAGYEYDDLKDRPGVQLIFIIDELPIHSRSRLKFLEAETKNYPQAKFLFVTRAEAVVVADSGFTSGVAADAFELSGISFLEISHFVQKNFGMTGSESEVIALRLSDTFRSFDLSAHPTYFAGIPREILSALLQANRRGELIQLAVDGFLTFVVAGDNADVTLSRTTRSRFLRKLAVELNVEKRLFSQEELVSFTREFSRKFDFGIDPMAFINSFVDAGILHFSDNKIEFSLPFIESYVLASELAANEAIALRYFILGPDFDLNTFDLYAEIGASDRIVCNIIEGLEVALKDYGLKPGEQHVLLTDRVRPHLLSNQEQLEIIQNRLRKTAEDVEHGKGDTVKKQKLLDVADRIKEEVADTARPGDQSERSEEDERVARVIQNWLVATSLLGAGAEHLSAEMKQMLAGLLIDVSSIIAHHGTVVLLDVDFTEVKKRLQSDESFLATFKDGIEGKDDVSIQRFIGGIVDILEYSLLSGGLRRVLHQLCEGARQRVLATSIEKAPISGPIEAIIHGAWLSDIESRRGREYLLAAIKQLPASPFLRSLLSAHFLTRTYWNHWQKDDRMALLNAAAECLKGMGVTLNKGEIKRLIENSDETQNEN